MKMVQTNWLYGCFMESRDVYSERRASRESQWFHTRMAAWKKPPPVGLEGLLVAAGHGGVVQRRHEILALCSQRRAPYHETPEFRVWPAVFRALVLVLLFSKNHKNKKTYLLV